MYRPEGCCYPDCFSCPLPDCEYEEEDLQRDLQSAAMRQKRREDPEYYRRKSRLQKQQMEQKDPGHYARLQREWRRRHKQKEAENANR